MKKVAVLLLIAAMLAVFLCACGSRQQKPTEPVDYTGTYVYKNTTMREITTRTIVIRPDGTYTFTRVSTIEENNGEYGGTWEIDDEGCIIFTAGQTGKTSRGKLSSDTLRLDVADIDRAVDTVGNGIYFYQFPRENEATPDAG